jgi:heat shock protein HtpX
MLLPVLYGGIWLWLALLEFLIYIALLAISVKLAPRVQSKLAERLSLQASMLLTLLGIILVSATMIYVLLWALGANLRFVLTWAIIPVVLLSILQYLLGPYMVELFYGLREAPQELTNSVNSLARELGLKSRVKVYIYDGEPNAFAFGNFLLGKRIAISRSLIELLEPDELRAVIGHELGHHLHHDNALIFAISLLPSLVYNLSYWLLVSSLFTESSDDRDNEEARVYGLLLGILGIAVSLLLQILVLAFSRLREYYADRVGARAAGKLAMQAALAKLHVFYEANPRILARIRGSSIRQLFIYALLETLVDKTVDERLILIERARNASYSIVQEILSTHPPISKRIKALDKL